ncbi:cytochrome b [Shewanella marisflavi]|uniref:Cytochrome b n=1 Tax=Shewanella marisflavi TaxID=260364 RepID=A0AAC9U320_9GAMM|nr:cytochrome b [Shewanella marisflavi]ASJ97561.1 cytochrome b [Shewanella marisflavi]
MFKNTQSRYGVISIALHWLSAIVVLVLFALGVWMVELTYYSPWYKQAPDLHKSIGVLLLVATLCRLLWRGFNPAPKALTEHKRWEQVSAAIVHRLLYLLLIAILITGYLISTADGRAIGVFSLLELPSLGRLFEGQADIAGWLHQYLAYGFIALVSLHALGAIKHHLIDRDATLKRMLNIKETQ